MLKPIDFIAKDAPQQLVDSLHEIGFAVITNHPIPFSDIEQVYQRWDAFFNGEEKWQYEFDPKTHDGYIPAKLSETAKGASIKDIKEFYHYYYGQRVPSNLEAVTKNMYKALESLAENLLTWVNDYSPKEVQERFSMPLPEMVHGCEKTMYRILYYPPFDGNEEPGAVRAAAHGDINTLTMLPSASEPGLQVQLKDGSWFDVPCDNQYIIVNIGDMLEEASGFYYPSTRHRVINPTGAASTRARISTPLFLHAFDEVKLSDKYTAASYRAERYAELGLD